MKKRFIAGISIALMLGFYGCKKQQPEEAAAREGAEIKASNGYGYGELRDTAVTKWFLFTVNDVTHSNTYGTLTSGEGKEFVIVQITLKNTDERNCSFYDSDFQLQWDDAFALPVTYGNPLAEQGEMLKGSYVIKAGEEKTGDLVFEKPAGDQTCQLVYQEYDEFGTTGDIFVIQLD